MDFLRNGVLAGGVTLLAQVSDLSKFPYEKIGIGAILFMVLWIYLNKILPKTNETIDSQNKRMENLVLELSRLNCIIENQQKTIEGLVKKLQAITKKELE